MVSFLNEEMRKWYTCNFLWPPTRVSTNVSCEDPSSQLLTLSFLSMNYHNIYDKLVSIYVGLARARQIHEELLKDLTTITI